MERIILGRPGAANSNEPAANNEAAQQPARPAQRAAANIAQAANQAGLVQPVARVDAPIIPAEPTRSIKLTDLKLGNESNTDLVSVPVPKNRRVIQLRAQPDELSANLHGRDYLRFLSTDNRLMSSFKLLMGGRSLLGNDQLTEEALDRFEEKLRFITCEAYQNLDLNSEIDDMANEVLGYCVDRSGYFINQAHDIAMVSLLQRAGLEEVDLYNLGIAHFKLDLVQREVTKILGGRGIDQQSTHDYFDAEYFLQDRLHLPTRHPAPVYLNRRVGNMTQELAAEIGDRIEAKIAADNGESAIAFMADWGPWQRHITTKPEHLEDFNLATEIGHTVLENLASSRVTSGTAEFAMPEPEFIIKMDRAAIHNRNLKREFVAQCTRTLLENLRADLLIEHGAMPRYFFQV